MTADIPTGDIMVTVDHPMGEVEVPLEDWIREGPGPRVLVQLSAARRISTGEPIPLDAIDDPWRRDPPQFPG